jgi:hypothetical protein
VPVRALSPRAVHAHSASRPPGLRISSSSGGHTSGTGPITVSRGTPGGDAQSHPDLVAFQSRDREFGGRHNKPGESLLWMLDSSATKHIYNDVNAKSRIRLTPGWFVKCAASQRVAVDGIGDAMFSLPNGQLPLQEVLLVPSMSTSLLSIIALDEASFSAWLRGCCALHHGTELVLVAQLNALVATQSIRPGSPLPLQ